MISQKSKQLFSLAKFGVALAILYLLSRQINPQEFLSTVKSAQLLPLFIFVLLYPFSVFVSTLRWQVFLEAASIQIPFTELFKGYWISSLVNSFLPTEFGGDVVRSYDLGKQFNVSKKTLFLTSFLERLTGLFTLVVFIVVFHPLLFLEIGINLGWSFAVYFSIGSLVSFGAKKIRILDRVIKRISHTRLALIATSFKKLRSRNSLQQIILTSLVFTLQSMLAYWLCFAAFGVYIPWHFLLIMVPLIQITGILPFTPNALGIREGIGVWLSSLVGINPEISLLALLVLRGLLLATSGIGGIYLMMFTKSKSSVFLDSTTNN